MLNEVQNHGLTNQQIRLLTEIRAKVIHDGRFNNRVHHHIIKHVVCKGRVKVEGLDIDRIFSTVDDKQIFAGIKVVKKAAEKFAITEFTDIGDAVQLVLNEYHKGYLKRSVQNTQKAEEKVGVDKYNKRIKHLKKEVGFDFEIISVSPLEYEKSRVTLSIMIAGKYTRSQQDILTTLFRLVKGVDDVYLEAESDITLFNADIEIKGAINIKQLEAPLLNAVRLFTLFLKGMEV